MDNVTQLDVDGRADLFLLSRRAARWTLHTVWLLLACGVFGLLLGGLPAWSARLRAEFDPALALLGLSAAGYAGFMLTGAVVSVLFHSVVGGYLLWRRPRDGVAWMVALTLLTNGALLPLARIYAADPLTGVWRWALAVVTYLGLVSCFAVLVLFPEGQLRPRWTGLFLLAWALLELPVLLTPAGAFAYTNWPPRVQVALLFGFTAVAARLLARRYRHAPSAIARQQMKWGALGLLAALLGPLAYAVPYVIAPTVAIPAVPNLFVQRVGWSFLTVPVLLQLIGQALFWLLTLLFPLSFAIAVLRYRLWEIDDWLGRAMLYALLTGAAVALYGLVVGTLAVVMGGRAGGVATVIAVMVLAIAVNPLRSRLQTWIATWLYGPPIDAVGVLAALGRQIETVETPNEILAALATCIAQTLDLPYVAIVMPGEVEPRAFVGRRPAAPQVWPLVHLGRPIGQIEAAARPAAAPLTQPERHLFDLLLQQAAVVVYGVHLAFDLQRAREKLVVTREEERRRLRRDLHDGLGPHLAGLTLQLDAARNMLARDPAAVDAQLYALRQQTQEAIQSIRQIVNELRPAVLDQFGLVEAVRQAASALATGDLDITIEAGRLPTLGAAVEVAVYRIAVEALTNVARHAAARRCHVTLATDPDGQALLLTVIDDGRGIAANRPPGVGIAAMRERAAELGGTLRIRRGEAGGTVVSARIPLS